MPSSGKQIRYVTLREIDELPELQQLPVSHRQAMRAVAQVLPFRTNSYVVGELIDWTKVPDDPIYQLTFPQPGMLAPAHFQRITCAKF